MLPSTSTGMFSIAAAAALLVLTACGAGDGSAPVSAPQAVPEPSLAHEHAQDQEHEVPKLLAESVAPLAPAAPAALPAAPVEADAAAPALAPAATLEALTLASVLTPLIKATYYVAPYWPVWWGNGKPVDGVNCLVSGKFHNHVLLSIYKDGKRLGFPDGIGRVHAGCYHAYEMHVHDATGIVHMESDVAKTFKLGQWFSLWGLGLSRTGAAGLAGPVRFYIVDNHRITRYDGNPYDIVMLPHREILIVTGTQMTVVPNYQWPTGI
ncbi:hypothetical protein PO883_00225 [Massilia sp. DJPM01]|uniref:hypothetical protein n=1 Tax=Massilia sp. DJPM01 TaxID=3024404 RepID=UPI00259D4A58|nr:hypothetical protein [Massilia sp. DJPM01]MDM5175636.1 hypothetical protein [Massilia sp. DJPM01]